MIQRPESGSTELAEVFRGGANAFEGKRESCAKASLATLAKNLLQEQS
jgi:hypothetical protein